MNISMNEKEAVWYIVNTVLPLLIAVFQQPEWSDRRRVIVSLLVTWVLTFLFWLYMWISEASLGALTLTTPVVLQLFRMLGSSAMIVLVSYMGAWKPSGIAGRVELMTTKEGSPAKTILANEVRAKESDKA